MATVRQKKVAKKLVENIGAAKPKSKGEIVREAGYSAAMAKNPQVVIEAPGVQQEIAKIEKRVKDYFTDEFLAGKLKALLDKKETIRVFNHATGEYEKEVIEQPETQAVSKGLELVFKIRGDFAPEKSINLNINHTQDSERLQQLAQQVNALRRAALQRGGGEPSNGTPSDTVDR